MLGAVAMFVYCLVCTNVINCGTFSATLTSWLDED